MSNPKGYRIALAANSAWSIYNFRLGIIRALLSKGYEVIAIAPRDDYADKLTAEGVQFVPIKLQAHSISPLQELRTWRHIYKIYNRLRPDLIIQYTIKLNLYGSICSHWLGLESISVVTGLGRTFQIGGWKQALVNRLYKYASSKNKEVWVLNKEDKALLIKKSIVQSDKLFILPSEGVNLRRFKSSIPKADKKYFRLLYAGRLLKDKGILEYIEVAKKMTQQYYNIIFDVVGFVNPEDNMSISLEDLRRWQQKGYINYLGSHEDVRPFIDRADCIIYPSYYREGISRILLEAASMGRPIITTDQVGCRDVVEHGKNGLIVPVKSVPHLVQAIKELLDMSHEDRVILGQSGRRKVRKEFDESIIIKIYFDRIISGINKIRYSKDYTHQKS